MPLIGIVARKKDIKDIKRKLGENYELIELNSESIKNLKNIKFDEIIYNKDINLTEEEYKFMREIINKTKYILINSDEKIKIPENILIKIITFGFNSKSTIMISSVKENYIIISVQREIEKLEQENLNFSKKSHSMAHKQRALEYKLNHLLMKEETSKELEIKTEIENLSKELYQIPIEDLPSTEITQIDDMLEFMQSECVKNKIDFNLQIIGNVYHIINNIITVEQLEILIADHIKDAIIAIKHTDNINKSILVKLGKIDGCYGLYIYDSGIEFEKETLKNLGKKPSTTHKDEGGTGMGFMNTFDTLNECKGSLVIKEIGKPSKDNFTKIIMIKFDGKNEYKVESYR